MLTSINEHLFFNLILSSDLLISHQNQINVSPVIVVYISTFEFKLYLVKGNDIFVLLLGSGSVPNLTSCNRSSIFKQNSISPTAQRIHTHHRTSKSATTKERSSRILHGMQRNILNKSVDEAGVYFPNAKMSLDSQCSIGKDAIEIFSSELYANKRDRNKRSDTAKRHILARQKQIDSSEMHNLNTKPNFKSNRRYFMSYLKTRKKFELIKLL